MTFQRLILISVVAVLGLAAILFWNNKEREFDRFRIGTGSLGGTYYPVGEIIAGALNDTYDTPACQAGEACGVKGLTAVAIPSKGSVSNLNMIYSRRVEAGFSQADVAFWAYAGKKTFADKGPMTDLRVIANLYPEHVHIVARKGANIKSVKDLKGKRVSLDKPGSGTLVDARLILNAYNMNEEDIEAEYISMLQATGKLKAGELDAFFLVAGYPSSSVATLAATEGIELVPIEGVGADALARDYKFFSKDFFPAKTYGNKKEIKTLSVGAQLFVRADRDEDQVYEIVKTLWGTRTRQMLDAGHIKGKLIQLTSATEGLSIPLHPGAERFYREAGVLQK